jgi:hypothetical protein
MLHLAAVALIVTEFAVRCRISTLGATWAMIAQTVLPITSAVVAAARNMTDDEVKDWLTQRSIANKSVGLSLVHSA